MDNKDILQKIASLSDDVTALRILSTNKKLNKDEYYHLIFGERYPDLIHYKEEDETYKQFYLRMLEAIGLLKEKYNIKYGKNTLDSPINYLDYYDRYYGEMAAGFFKAVQNGDLETINHILDSGKYPFPFRVIEESVGLAAKYGHLEIVKYLSRGLPTIPQTYLDALIKASKYGHLEIVKYLLNKLKHSIERQEDDEKEGQEEEKEENIKKTKYDLFYPALLAMEKGHFEIAQYFLENTEGYEDLFLIFGSEFGVLSIVRLALEKGADVNTEDGIALLYAATRGHLPVVKYLVEHGADVHANNDVALRGALYHKHYDVVNYLKQLK